MPPLVLTRPNTKPDLAAILLAEHDCVTRLQARWDTFLRVYEGGIRVRDLLVQHQREHESSFLRRKQRTYYLNFCQPIIDIYSAFIYNRPPVRSADRISGTGGVPVTPDELQEFYRDVDGKGHDMNNFMKKFVHRRMNIFGHVYVVVDMPRLTETLLTEADRLAFGLRPYLYTVDPPRVINWAQDAAGRFLWIRWKEDAPDQEDPFSPELVSSSVQLPRSSPYTSSALPMKATMKAQRVRTWTRTQWFLHEIRGKEVNLIDEGPNPLGEVPVVLVVREPSSLDPGCGISALTDLSGINVAIYQWTSLLDEELHQKVMSILTLHKDVADESTDVIIGSNNVLEYTGNIPPQFIATPTAPAQMILESIDRLKTEMFTLAHLGGTLNPTRGQSGVSHAFDFNETNQALAEQALVLENAEQQIHRLWAAWLNEEWRGTIDYPEEFGIELFDEELTTLSRAVEEIKSVSFARIMRTKLANKFLYKEDDAVKAQVAQEIAQTTAQRFFFEQQQFSQPDQGVQQTPQQGG
ncbi:MAG: hypothetical protein Q9M19_04915 [Mariprofundaceae bacterium]|nr:hypothetical protein [Mariprofundaceae bacterium]